MRYRLLLLVVLGVAGSSLRHADFFAAYWHERWLMAIWSANFALGAIQWIMSFFEKPHTVTPLQAALLERQRVAVNLPVYNEDPALLDRALFALFAQTRLPGHVVVVDDGSKVDYAEVRDFWTAHRPPGVEFSWIRQDNQGKKAAQATAFRGIKADILVTLDSDTALAPNALEEGLKPFADRRVQSVAGMELAFNYRKNWLTRLNGTRSLIWQLLSCSAQSVVGDVLVNRGTFALYRAAVIQDNLYNYVHEEFFGHHVHLGDDAALTLFARGRGRAVQQPTAVQFTMYPETVSHQTRQWIRWMRGLTVRTFWRVRYLPLWSYGWWFTVLSLWMFFASSAALLAGLAEWPSSRAYLLTMLAASTVWAWGMALRVFTVIRSDETWLTRLGIFVLAPVTSLWVTVVLRPLRFYGIFTCLHSGWVTRTNKVEVELGDFTPAELEPAG